MKKEGEKNIKGMETMILVWIIGVLDFCMEKYRFLYTSTDAMVSHGIIKP